MGIKILTWEYILSVISDSDLDAFYKKVLYYNGL
jgi:hypothetical protein